MKTIKGGREVEVSSFLYIVCGIYIVSEVYNK